MRQFGCPLGIELMPEEPAGFGRGERELVGEHFRRGIAAAGQVGWVSQALAGTSIGAESVDGVTVAAANYQEVGGMVAAGDKDDRVITPEIRRQFRAVKRASIAFADSPVSLGNLLDPRLLAGGFAGNLADDSLIDAYLTGSTLETFRAFTLTEREKAVLEAIYGHGDLETALAALPTAYTEDYKRTVRWYAGAFNAADLRVDVQRNGRITSTTGDGIRAIRRFPGDDHGAAHVVIHEGGRVTAHRYGVRMIGAGREGTALRQQTVEVYGELESTGPDGAAIALQGGGDVVIGPDTVLTAASGTTILVDRADTGNTLDACVRFPCEGDNLVPGTNLRVQINPKEGEDLAQTFARAVPGRIVNAGPTRVCIISDGHCLLLPVLTTTAPASPTPGGGGGGSSGGPTSPTPAAPVPPAPESDDAAPTVNPTVGDTTAPTWLTLTAAPAGDPAARMVAGAYGVWMTCDRTACALRNALEPHARVAAALPAILLDMMPGPDPTRGASGSSGTGPTTGTWARVIASAGDREITDSPAATAYSLQRRGVTLGTAFSTGGGTFGVSVSHQSGAAEIDDGGEIDTTALGAGLSWHWDQGPYTIGIPGGATTFSSDLTATARGTLAHGLDGSGWVAGLTASRQFTWEGAVLDIAGGLTHAQVKTDGFTAQLADPHAPDGTATVPVGDVSGTDTRLRLHATYQRPLPIGAWFVGAGVEGSLDSDATARVGNTPLASEKDAAASLTGGLVVAGTGGEQAILSLGVATTGGGDRVQAGLDFSF